MSESPIAKRLNEASVLMEDTPHPELVVMLKIGAEEIQRLWDQSEKRYWANQRLEGEAERLEAALRKMLIVFGQDGLGDGAEGDAVAAARACFANDRGAE